MFRTILISTVSSLALASAAFAADLPSRKSAPIPAPVYAAPIFTWTGFYVGLQGGGEWADVSGPFGNAAQTGFGPYTVHPNGGLLGARVGYNWQVNNFVFGLEGDANAALGVRGTASNVLWNGTTLYDIRAKQTWTADIRGRLGYAIDRFLIYTAGGVAFGNVQTSYAFAGASPFLTEKTTRSGWTLGAGVEYAFTNNIIGNAEYRYTDLGHKSFTDTTTNTFDNVKFKSSAVLVGVSYKF